MVNEAKRSPYRLPPRQWFRAAKELKDELKRDNISIIAASLAFYGMLAMFPSLIALVSLYGLFLDPAHVEEQVAPLSAILPPTARELVTDQLHDLVSGQGSGLRWSLLLSMLAVLWSASTGVNALFRGVNLAYFQVETRNWLKLRAIALLTTLGVVLFAIVALASVALLPPLLHRFGVESFVQTLVTWLRWPVLCAAVIAGLALIYRFAPDHPRKPPFRWVTPGSIFATTLWLLASIGFSYYVGQFGNYNETYGALGAVIVLLLWMFLSAYAILVGAELNAILERRAGLLKPRGGRTETGAPLMDREAVPT